MLIDDKGANSYISLKSRNS